MTRKPVLRLIVSNCRLLCVRHLFPFLVVDTELLRHRLERRIELNESVLDSTVRVVTRPAAVPFRHGLGGLALGFKAEVSPPFQEPDRILYLNPQYHQIYLKST